MGNAAATLSNAPLTRTVASIGRKTSSEAALASGAVVGANSNAAAVVAGINPSVRNFTLEEFAKFNGENDQPVYVSLLSDVYDVTGDFVEYGPRGLYHVLAGRDASRAVARMCLEEDDVKSTELEDMTPTHLESLDDWVRLFREDKQYPKVGRLILPRDCTLVELRKYNGVDNPRHTVLVGLNGGVYDVTLYGWEHCGPDGGYHQFAGRDASRALACMSFLDEYLDNPSLEELTSAQRDALANWSTRFDQKYPLIGKLIAHKEGQ